MKLYLDINGFDDVFYCGTKIGEWCGDKPEKHKNGFYHIDVYDKRLRMTNMRWNWSDIEKKLSHCKMYDTECIGDLCSVTSDNENCYMKGYKES